jgi:hypothetical protein
MLGLTTIIAYTATRYEDSFSQPLGHVMGLGSLAFENATM